MGDVGERVGGAHIFSVSFQWACVLFPAFLPTTRHLIHSHLRSASPLPIFPLPILQPLLLSTSRAWHAPQHAVSTSSNTLFALSGLQARPVSSAAAQRVGGRVAHLAQMVQV